ENGQQEIVQPIIKILNIISSTDITNTTGYGHFDANGVAQHSTWKSFLTSIGDDHHYNWDMANGYLDMKLIRSMIEIIEHLSDICTEKRCLIHGDFGSYNLLTTGGNITAVIDWDLAIFGDPLYEIASLLFWNETHMQGVIDYYSSFIIQHK